MERRDESPYPADLEGKPPCLEGRIRFNEVTRNVVGPPATFDGGPLAGQVHKGREHPGEIVVGDKVYMLSLELETAEIFYRLKTPVRTVHPL